MRKAANNGKSEDLTVLPKGENPIGDEKKSTPEGELSDATIASRVRAGKSFCTPFASVDKAVCASFRDATGNSIYPDADYGLDYGLDQDGDVLSDQPVGVSNEFQKNVLTLAAATIINEPGFFVRAGAPKAADLVRKEVARQWKKKSWNRKTRGVFQKRCIGGLGILAYRWERKKRTVFELIHSWNLVADPTVRDWNDLRWGGYEIQRSLREAIETYDPDGTKGIFKEKIEERDRKGDTASKDRMKVRLTLYWDSKTEAVIYGGKVVDRKKNLYEGVPLLFLECDIDPGPTAFPLGLGILTSGHQRQIVDLDSAVTNTAKHGGPLNIVNTMMLTKELRQAWTEGQEQGLLGVKTMPDKAFMRVPGEEVSSATLLARQQAKRDMHGIMGTNDTMFGQHIEGVTKATEAANIQQNSGARQVQARVELELFIDRMLEAVVRLEAAFGGATKGADGRVSVDKNAREMWEAFKSVEEIYVTASSTVYRDPKQDQQQSMQVEDANMRQIELLLSLGMPPPMALVLMLRMKKDTMQAFGRTNIDEYLPGVDNYIELLQQTYLPGLMQGQLPPPPDHGKLDPGKVTASIDKLPWEAQQALLLQWGLIQPGQQVTPPQQAGEGDGADVSAMAEVTSAKLKAEDAEKGRIAEMVKQESEHRHQALMQEHGHVHAERMAHVGAIHKLITTPEPAKGAPGSNGGVKK